MRHSHRVEVRLPRSRPREDRATGTEVHLVHVPLERVDEVLNRGADGERPARPRRAEIDADPLTALGHSRERRIGLYDRELHVQGERTRIDLRPRVLTKEQRVADDVLDRDAKGEMLI